VSLSIPAIYGIIYFKDKPLFRISAMVMMRAVQRKERAMSTPSNTSETAQRNVTRRSAIAAAVMSGVGASISEPAAAADVKTAARCNDLAVRHRTIAIDGVEIFYREAGKPDAPAVLLLHGFPTSSHMFRHLIPALADRWRVVAPDYPGFGQSGFPPRDRYDYSFASFADTMAKFTDAVGLDRFAMYIQDYGAPVGLRLALNRPDRILAIIAQNGNAYEEGLSEGWTPIKAYWNAPTMENRNLMRGWLNQEGTRQQYVGGVPDEHIELFSPDSWTIDWALLNRPGNIDLQLDLFYDYRTNVALYPDFHRFFRERRPAMLIPWGRQDPFFTVAGAQAYLRDLPDAELNLLDAGHFALESHTAEITDLVRSFLAKLQM
jgi:pimeloyl-ACP methyl ester carboxylesterase